MDAEISDIRLKTLLSPGLSQILVEVHQEDGLTGTGECWWGVEGSVPSDTDPHHLMPIVSCIEHLFKPELVGKASGQINRIRTEMIQRGYRYGTDGIFMCALSGIDIALWDLLGRKLDVPVAQLFGGTVKDAVRAYASLPPLKEKELIKHEVRRAIAAGFMGIKLHETNPETANWTREAAGPDINIMYDVNGAYTPEEAMKVTPVLASAGVFWFEEPIWPMRDLETLFWFGKNSGIPLASGENEFNLERCHRLIKNRSVEFIMPEITKIGGLTVAREISVLAELHNKTLTPHGYRIGPALYANIHWALTSRTADWLEIPFLPEGYSFPSEIRMPALKDGRVSLPSGAGLGLAFL